MSNFINILLSKGYSESPTGRWLPPDYKHGNNLLVEVEGSQAVVYNVAAACLFVDSVEDVAAFRTAI